VTFDHLGAFPHPRRATVLWLGVSTGVDRLGELAADCEDAAQAIGYEPESRPYRPHLTLSRIRPDQDLRPLVDGLAFPAVSFTARSIALFRSMLGRGGARYEVVENFPL
jgi:2'-5' RNA ligase